MNRGRWVLVAFAVAGLILILSPVLVFWTVQPTLCPTSIVNQGRIEGGVAWEFTRSDCPGERVVWQVRVAPLQGVLRLAYDAESGPEPVGIEQLGRMVIVRLRAPLRDGATSVSVELDPRGRPREPARIRNAERVSAYGAVGRGRFDMAGILPL